jgi:hypothetical protein
MIATAGFYGDSLFRIHAHGERVCSTRSNNRLPVWPSTVGWRCAHLLVFSPQSHLTCDARDFRIARQCEHCETGRPFLLMC